jgi:hypothetical protein
MKLEKSVAMANVAELLAPKETTDAACLEGKKSARM